MIRWRFPCACACCFALLLLVGCGSDGPPRYGVHGTVTFDGQPIPKGFIKLLPDASQGNDGPGGGAPIENGKYATPSGKGIIGGPHVVRIVGFDGVPTAMGGEELADGKSLFPPYETTINFPKEDAQQDFNVPKSPN